MELKTTRIDVETTDPKSKLHVTKKEKGPPVVVKRYQALSKDN